MASSDDIMKFRRNAKEGKIEELNFDGIPNQALSFALREACLDGNKDLARILLQHGADVHFLEDVPLRYASRKGYTDIVQLLLDYGANVHAENDEALISACRNKDKATAELLLQHGANKYKCEYPFYNELTKKFSDTRKEESFKWSLVQDVRSKQREERGEPPLNEEDRIARERRQQYRLEQKGNDSYSCKNKTNVNFEPINIQDANIYTVTSNERIFCYTKEELLKLKEHANMNRTSVPNYIALTAVLPWIEESVDFKQTNEYPSFEELLTYNQFELRDTGMFLPNGKLIYRLVPSSYKKFSGS